MFVRYYGQLRRLFPSGSGRGFHYYFYVGKRRLMVTPRGRNFAILRTRFGTRTLRIVRKFIGAQNTSVCCASIRRYVRKVLRQRCTVRRRQPRRRYVPRKWLRVVRRRKIRYLRRIQRRRNRRSRFLRWRRRRRRRIIRSLKKFKNRYIKRRRPRRRFPIIGGPGTTTPKRFLRRPKIHILIRKGLKRFIQYRIKKGPWSTIRYTRRRKYRGLYKFTWRDFKLTRGIIRVNLGNRKKPKWKKIVGARLR